jgi:cyclophilin family peptidyl-prolyl cis-trans isomerase
VNTVDNAFLDFPGSDGWGYCVFGKVVDGMETVDKIRDTKTMPGDRPVKPVIITGAVIEGAPAAPAKKAVPHKKKK